MRRRIVAVLTLVLPMAIGGTVAAFAAPGANNPPPAAAPAEVVCQLVVPANPLTAQGLATPYQLEGSDGQSCQEANPDDSAFAQGLIIDPATGQVSVYNPLIIDEGTTPAIPPVVPALPSDAVVALWFGFNGDVLTLTGPGVASGACVDGLPDSPFGQVSYCDASNFFNAANQAIANGQLVIPPLGTAKDGLPCMTTRDFGLVDQDQSDNVTTMYLALPNGQTAQDTSINATSLDPQGAQLLANGSDNLLLDHFVDPALGCTPYAAPDLANGGALATNLGLNELQAAADQGAPVALVPLNDPMTLDNNGDYSDAKTDLYREGVDQPMLSAASGDGAQYCINIIQVGMARIQKDASLTETAPTPDAGMANNLFTFLASRLQQSYINLNCQQLTGQPNPITITTDANGVAVAAAFSTFNPSASPSASASTSQSGGASASSSPTTAPPTSAAPTCTPTTAAPTSAAPTSAAPTTAPPATSAAPPASYPATTAQAPPPPATTQAVQPATPAVVAKSSAAAGSGGGSGGSGGSGSGSGSGGSGSTTGTDNQGSTGGGSGSSAKPAAEQSTAAAASKPKASATGSSTAGADLEVAGFRGQKPPNASATATVSAQLAGSPDVKSMNARIIWALVGSLGALLISLLLWPPNRRRRKKRAMGGGKS